MCVGRDLFFAALFFCSALLWSDLCRSLPECFALTCLLSLVCLHRLLVCSPAWPLPVALVVKLSNFVCLKQEGAGLVAGEESAGPINCLTLDSHGIFVGVGGVNGLVGVVGRLPCRPRAGVVSLSICVSRSLCVALSLSLFLFLVLSFSFSFLCRKWFTLLNSHDQNARVLRAKEKQRPLVHSLAVVHVEVFVRSSSRSRACHGPFRS